MNELDHVKDDRASLNALTEQFNATMRHRLAGLSVEELYDFARAFGIEPTDYGVDELPAAILEELL